MIPCLCEDIAGADVLDGTSHRGGIVIPGEIAQPPWELGDLPGPCKVRSAQPGMPSGFLQAGTRCPQQELLDLRNTLGGSLRSFCRLRREAMRDHPAGFLFVIPGQDPVVMSDRQLRHLEFIMPGAGYVFDEMGQAIAEKACCSALERLQALDRRCSPLLQPSAQERKGIARLPAGAFIGGGDPVKGAAGAIIGLVLGYQLGDTFD